MEKKITYAEAKKIELANNTYKGIEFSDTKKAYVYDDENKCLIEQGETNIYEAIQSNADCALNVILDKYLDLGIDVGNVYNIITDENADVIDDCLDDRDKLEVTLKYHDYMNELRTKYSVPDNVSDTMFMEALKNEVVKKQAELDSASYSVGGANNEEIQVEKKSEQN